MNTQIESNEIVRRDKRGIFTRMTTLFLGRKVNIIEEQDTNTDLINSIHKAKTDWDDATHEFEYIKDDDAIDYCTYRIKACQIKYEYLLKEAKQKGIKLHK